MKFIIAVVLVLVLSSCDALVGIDQINKFTSVCETHGGTEKILMNTTIASSSLIFGVYCKDGAYFSKENIL